MTDARLPLASWFNEIIHPLFSEACFADPIYGGNRDAVFWKMIGYPGLPATHSVDMVRYRGKPYPGAKNPKSIIDFS
jgi:gluconate 2-dehydrogenase gamma chain